MKRIVVALVVVVALAIGGYVFWHRLAGRETTDDAQVDGHIHYVSARVGGSVAAVKVEENQFVEADAVLIEIDNRDYRIALARAEADIADAEAGHVEAAAELPVVSNETAGQISSSEALMTKARSSIDSAAKDREVAGARLNLARARAVEAQAAYNKVVKDLDRLKPLIAKDEISRQQYDTAVAAVDSAKAAVDSSHAAIAEAESAVIAAESRIGEARGNLGVAEAAVQTARTTPEQINVSRARVSAASARIARARTALERAKTDIEYTIVRAPAAGIVSRRNIEAGQVVQPGQPLMAIVPLTELWVTANFKETQLEKMKPGQPAEIRVDAFGGAKFAARVESIGAATGARFSLLPAENASGNFVKVVQRVPVRLVLEAAPGGGNTLRPGMSVAVTVQTEAEK